MNHHAFTQIILDALAARASDIHFEPAQEHVQVRFRIDGLMSSAHLLSKSDYAQCLVRFKHLAGLDIAQSLRPQDGRFSFETHARHHFRVHTCPTLMGEKMVIRLLPESQQRLMIGDLGLHPAQETALLRVLHQRAGLIIVTGPTGSGKTMTLYACLEWLKTQPVQITTLEDPVEIPLAGTTQIPILEKQGVTFAHALRAVLRQDPDVILVGEMRDVDTADIAIRAALTGHLVLTSLHSPHATAAIRRLENMQIPLYNLMESVSLIVAQRLVRRPQGGRLGVFELFFPAEQTYAAHMTLADAGTWHVAEGNAAQADLDRVL